MPQPRPPSQRSPAAKPARPERRPLAPGVEVRVLAAQVLDAVVHRGRSLKSELAAALPRLPDSRDRALLEAIAFAALRGRYRYAPALRGWLQKPPGANDGPLLALLLAGCAQLDALHLPAHAALDATVEAARALGRPHQAGLVNALLRRAQREGIPPADPAGAWPDWLRARIEDAWPGDAAAVFAASAQPAPMWLRVNRARTTRDDYLARLYRTAGDRLHFNDWDASIQRKLDVLWNVYQGLADQAANRRSEVLEWIIIGLIAADIVLYFTPLR